MLDHTLQDDSVIEDVQIVDDVLQYTEWVQRGAISVRRDALDYDDPDHLYNRIVALGYRPENFGVEHPLKLAFESYTREMLIDEIVNQRKELKAWIQYA